MGSQVRTVPGRLCEITVLLQMRLHVSYVKHLDLLLLRQPVAVWAIEFVALGRLPPSAHSLVFLVFGAAAGTRTFAQRLHRPVGLWVILSTQGTSLHRVCEPLLGGAFAYGHRTVGSGLMG
jgi:hypothetical protein